MWAGVQMIFGLVAVLDNGWDVVLFRLSVYLAKESVGLLFFGFLLKSILEIIRIFNFALNFLNLRTA